MVLRTGWVLAAVLVLSVTGCARAKVESDAGPARDAPGIAGSPSCSFAVGRPTPTPGAAKQPLPDDFVPVTARRCVLTTVAVPGDGEWQVRDEQEATSGLDRLLRVLRRPSAPRGDGACPAIGVVPVDLTLVDAGGRTLDPSLPQDACGLPVAGAVEAVEALPWKSVKQTRVGRVRSQLELDSGCSGRYKPVVDLAATSGRRSTGPAFGGPTPSALTVCRYRLDPADPVSLDNGPPLATGVLDSAGTLTGASLANLVAAIAAAPAATGRCDQPQQPFAVLFPPGGAGPFLAVELGGCHRLLDGADQLRQLDAATVEALRR
jgi:hypothetical protein